MFRHEQEVLFLVGVTVSVLNIDYFVSEMKLASILSCNFYKLSKSLGFMKSDGYYCYLAGALGHFALSP